MHIQKARRPGLSPLVSRDDGDAKDGSLNEAYTVRDGDAALISRGFHPVGAAPSYSLYYFWVLAGEQRELVLFEDPDHLWLHDA